MNDSKELQTIDPWEEKRDLVKRTVAVGATDDELDLFLHQARKTGLDPLARQLVFSKFKGKVSIITTIDGYRLTADRTGLLAGSDDYLFDEGLNQYEHMVKTKSADPKTATVTVYKLVGGIRVPFTATAAMSAYRPPDGRDFMWKKMPHLMLGKCAEALALRKAFPMELSGVYTKEEMEQSEFPTDGFEDVPIEPHDVIDDAVVTELNDDEVAEIVEAPAPQAEKWERPLTPKQLREGLKKRAATWNQAKNQEEVEELVGTMGFQILASRLEACFDGSKDKQEQDRHDMLHWLWGTQSTKEMDNGQIAAMLKWLEVDNFEDEPNPDAVTEARGAVALLAHKIEEPTA